ncbi:E3 UBIQUITIN-PROTEIN LIGASE ARI5-RELATED [Salix viminalis]|uniref:RanBP-type and C3HC4-type zinc finger-containing protein 1 n=1 Tax=Salix viminalis TaxID=40686 RepID=A0A9Q0UHB8_SALVM|nr:E3 UBIQUITIN-PROTEIN LIGASE ARI5-RELATED [Salix viminalis]
MDDMNDFDDLDEYSPMDYYSDDNTDAKYHPAPSETNFTVLKEADICRCMEHEITELSAVLSISRLEASLLLRHYDWNASKVHDAWFVDESGVRKKVGLLLEKPEEKQISSDDLTCGICFESYSQDFIKSVTCGHPFCSECWGLYIHTKINDGPACLALRCPVPACSAAVGDDVINELAFEEDRKRTAQTLRNETWKKAYTKPCPKCLRPIEKNAGCMRISCTAPCYHMFCWICLKDWSVHGYGGSCNRYVGNPQPEETSQLRQELLKYQHYYDRWAANEKSRQIALTDLGKVRINHLKEISKLYGQPETQLEFLTEAWQQIVECRRVLKWTYAYGYYLAEDAEAKVKLFEYLQGQAESSLERLHDCAERELKMFIDPDELSDSFDHFRVKLIHLTGVTKNYFKNLVTALENGLSDVASSSKQQKTSICRRLEDPGDETCDRMTAPEDRSSYLAITRTSADPNKTKAPKNTTGASLEITTQTLMRRTDHENLTPQGEWFCEFCTCVNRGSAETCEACNQRSLDLSALHICQFQDRDHMPVVTMKPRGCVVLARSHDHCYISCKSSFWIVSVHTEMAIYTALAFEFLAIIPSDILQGTSFE